MARVKRSVVARKRHKKILKMAKGFYNRSSRVFRVAVERVEKSLQYAYRDRKKKKSEFRSLWIQRINAGVREHGLTYSQFMGLCKKADIQLDRKSLADLAANHPTEFKAVVEVAKKAAK